jgi:hypothetical protein
MPEETVDMIRHKENEEHRLTIGQPSADDPVLIVCPLCGSKAAVVPFGEEHVRAACSMCWFTAEKPSDRRTYHWDRDNPTDGYFGLNLWLTTTCDGHCLWAFNRKHLDFLESFVSARLRERTRDETRGWRNSSLASRLPAWIKSAKNRDRLVRAIRDLKAKA